MFGFSMIQTMRFHSKKLDRPLRNHLLQIYKPFKWAPCLFHKWMEKWLKKRKKLSVIVEFHKTNEMSACMDEVQILAKKYRKCRIHHQFSHLPYCSMEATPAVLEEMLASEKIKKIYLNREVKALLDVAIPSAHAKNVVRNQTLLTGKGVNIAILDTGIYPHPDLKDRIIAFKDFIQNRSAPYDDNGHGTHCAGDAAGNGKSSNGRYAGAAPEANLIGVKVLNRTGSGSLQTIMQGIEWCIHYNETHPNKKIHVLSMSLGAEPERYENEDKDPLVQYVEHAWDSGIMVCVAAGNEGPEPNTIASPGISDKVLTVGALDDRDTIETRMDDDVAEFSSRGPTIYGVTKPDILAPGVDIVSLRSPNSYLDRLQKSNRVGSYYFVLSGTSMATPIVAGIAALMLQYNPNFTPDEIKQRLLEKADLWKNRNTNVYGAGYVNLENAI